MSLAFTASLARALPGRTIRLKPLPMRRGSAWYASTSVAESSRAAIMQNNVMVFSKTTCPYCAAVKQLFRELDVDYSVWELDTRQDGDTVREFLLKETGQRTVPNIFIQGQHIGGCDDTLALHSQGKLLPLVTPE